MNPLQTLARAPKQSYNAVKKSYNTWKTKPDRFKTWVQDAFERACKTLGQVFSITLLGSGFEQASQSAVVEHAAEVAGLAVVVSIVTSGVTLFVTLSANWDVVYRSVVTFVQTWCAFTVAGPHAFGITDLPWVDSFAAATVAAIISVLTSWASWSVGPLEAVDKPSVLVSK